MERATLEIELRKGRPFAVFVHLCGAREGSARSEERPPSLVVDFDASGAVLGLEVLAFDAETIAGINDVLATVGAEPLTSEELAPLRAA